jgi:riboflavin synthase
MFSGIIETTVTLMRKEKLDQAERIWINRPADFNDIKIGDSICTNGVCLTVEGFDEKQIQFCLGLETLTLLKNSLSLWEKYPINLERSLRLGDRVHGHLVTGHADGVAKVVSSQPDGDVWILIVEVPEGHLKYFWKKGSACVNGVSLTINEIERNRLSFCLIPETLHVTNLKFFQVGDFINIESDYLAKAYIHSKGQDFSL